MNKDKRNTEYKYTGKLDVEKTVRDIRDTRIKNGNYRRHSKYLWDILELRNQGLPNREIAEEQSKKYGRKVSRNEVDAIMKNYSIQPNKASYTREKIEIKLLTEKEFNLIDLENLKTGIEPSLLIQSLLGGKVGGIEYKNNSVLTKIWKLSYEKYYKAA